jgi:hypothetical protein
MLFLLLSLAGWANTPGHVHPTQIAKHSGLYTQAAERAGTTFREREAQSAAFALALTSYQEGLDLLGERAPASERERLHGLRQRYHREHAVLQAFAQAMMEDFDEQFSAAMNRAMPPGVVVCEATVGTGPSLPGLPRRTQANPDCQGPDRNQDVAMRMDADPSLQSAVQELLALDWPTFSIEPEARPPIGGSRWIEVQPFMRSLIAARLDAIEREDERARIPLAAALEEGITPENRESLLAQGRAVTLRTSTARGSVAAPILRSVENAGPKVIGAPVGWCANPRSFGGCSGEAVPPAQVQTLRKNKKVLKASL